MSDYGSVLRATIAKLLAEQKASDAAAAGPAVVAEPEPVDAMALHERDWRYYKAALRRRAAPAAYVPFKDAWQRR